MTMSKLKEAQLAVILKHNPMRDDYHTGIRKLSDIKTFAEVVNDDESFVYGDFSRQDALNALKTGKITVYSSKAINLGDFVSTSRRMAQDYAGYSGRVYQRTVNLTDVAWINGDEGVYTGPIKLKEEKIMSIKIESAQVLSEKLKANLIALASKYHPEGVIKITPDITMTGAFTAVYTPAPQDYSPLVIHVAGGEIKGIGKRFGEETDPRIAKFKNAFNEAKKRAIAKQTQKPVAPVQPVQAPAPQTPAKPVQAPVQQAPMKVPLTRITFQGMRSNAQLIHHAKKNFAGKQEDWAKFLLGRLQVEVFYSPQEADAYETATKAQLKRVLLGQFPNEPCNAFLFKRNPDKPLIPDASEFNGTNIPKSAQRTNMSGAVDPVEFTLFTTDKMVYAHISLVSKQGRLTHTIRAYEPNLLSRIEEFFNLKEGYIQLEATKTLKTQNIDGYVIARIISNLTIF